MAEKSNNKAKERWYQHRLHHKKLLRIIIFQHGIYGKEEDRRRMYNENDNSFIFVSFLVGIGVCWCWLVLECDREARFIFYFIFCAGIADFRAVSTISKISAIFGYFTIS